MLLGTRSAQPLRTKRTLERSLDFGRDLDNSGSLTADTATEEVDRAAPRTVAAPPSSAEPDPKPKPAYPPAAATPTQQGPSGIRFDFNLGCRVSVPKGDWRIRLRDLDTGNILYETEVKQAVVSSRKRYYLRCGIEVFARGELVFEHRYSATDRDVLIQFPVGTLGDVLAWFPFAARFADVHGCRLTCAMSGLIIPLLRDAYPHVRFVTHEEVEPERFYATYYMGCSSTTLTTPGSRATSAMSGCTGRQPTSWVSIPPNRLRASPCRTRAGRSPSLTCASRRRALVRRNTGTTRAAGAR